MARAKRRGLGIGLQGLRGRFEFDLGIGACPGTDCVNEPNGNGSSEISGSIMISGATALQQLVQQAAENFMAEHPEAKITVTGGGSGTGLSQVSEGQTDIGMSDIFAEEKGRNRCFKTRRP